ncbi:Leucine-rich repeat protein [Giardia duodenalis]|uniref:Leucine-rich repeat protein n=1 Tax=Giardia intestinalis (strain ATCC 50803 / WB clone C6) TaxID=184922 RepID=A8BI35_GIAIC|nr:Leucine-rich repeat protein [Giardia intestinalis]KAE8302593.1 Leucine-rich repeat protein [Giardia intestinalis]|eukprot:XP_001706976.1 Hypothetical protein GL50803_13851 [Giardia lamblia ATCC 50803]
MRLSDVEVKQLSGEFSLSNVTRLSVIDRDVDDATILELCTAVFYLNLSNNKLRSAPFVKKMPSLQILILDGNPITSLGFLGELTDEGVSVCTAETISLVGCKISSLEELRHLSKMANLTNVDLTGNPVVSEKEFLRTILSTNEHILTVNHTRVRTTGGLLVDVEGFINNEKSCVNMANIAVEPVPWLPDSAFDPMEIPNFSSFCGSLEDKLRAKIAEYNAKRKEMLEEQMGAKDSPT